MAQVLKHPRKATTLLAAGAMSVVLLTGCGSSSSNSSTPAGTVSASNYIGQVCTSVVTWYKSISAHTNALESQLGPTVAPATSKTALTNFLSVSVSDTESVVSALHGAGIPAVKNGTKIATDLESAFEAADTTLKGLQPQVAAIATANTAGNRKLAEATSKRVTAATHALPLTLSALGGVSSPELDKATGESPACKAVGAHAKA